MHIGQLGKDPELRYIANGNPVENMRIHCSYVTTIWNSLIFMRYL